MPTVKSPEIIQSKIQKVHGDEIILDSSTYRNCYTKCKMIDKEYGEFWNTPRNVYIQKQSHPARRIMKILATRKKLGTLVDISKAKEIAVSKGGQCLSENLKTCKSKLKWMCGCGNVWTTTYNKVVHRNSWCPKCSIAKQKKTLMENYGVEVPCKNKDIALKAAKNAKKSIIINHWKTSEELICTASYEIAVVNFLNLNKIDFLWQPKTFETNIINEKRNFLTYRPDLYLMNENKWIEIKGYFRNESKQKWDWFHKEYPNSELWDFKKLKNLGIL